MRTSNYNFDIDKHSLIKPVVIIRSGDHDIDTIKITLSNQGDPVDLTNAKVKFMGTTPAGNKIIDDVHIKIVDATSGIFEYTFPSAAGSSTGEYQDAYFSIILGNGQTSTMNFRIQVLSGVDISAPAASDYVSQYNTMVSNLNSAYDSATHETNEKMAATVSSLATSAATVLDSALARVNDVDSKANSASSAASNAVSMAASVASTVTSQANYINSVASSAASNVSSVAASVVDKLNNISVGGRNYILNSKRALVGSGNVYDVGWVYSSMPISTFSNKKITVSVQVDYDNVTSLDGVSRIGFEVAANQKNADGTTVNKDIGAWRFPSVGDSFHGRIYSTFDLSNIKLESKYASSPNLFENGMFIQGVTGTNVSISNPKIEISNIATDWTPAPEDVDNKIDNIKVGGRNLYLNSKSDLIPKGFGINVAQTATIEHFDSTTDMLHIVSAQANGDSVGIYIFDYGNGKIPNNSDWSYSADIKGIGKIIKFGIEDSSIYTTKGVIGDNWSRVSQTGHVTEPKFKTLVMYFDTTDSPLDVYIKLPKLEIGNVPTDWTPAPEDADNTYFKNARILPADARDFAVIASDMTKYQGIWYTDGTAIANGPTDSWSWNTVEVLGGYGNGSGIIRTAGFGYNQEYITTVNGGKIVGWKKVGDDNNVVHKTSNETVAGDKTFTGNVTIPKNKVTVDTAYGTFTLTKTLDIVHIQSHVSKDIPDNTSVPNVVPQGFRPDGVSIPMTFIHGLDKGVIAVNPDGSLYTSSNIVPNTSFLAASWPVAGN